MAGDSNKSYPSPEKCTPTANTESAVERPSAEREFPENQRLEDDIPSRICVICFSEDGKAERGKLDSCDHYFCFVCIMEWARIESRCPACKGRFTTVHRMPNDDCLLRDRILKVPIRNQVPSGNSGPYDPYAETNCYVCEGMEDEGLMLLCDLCDSAAHTYCVGLGRSIPEGDWFCHDCTISRAQHANTESDINGDDQNQIATVESHVSISEVVQKSTETVGMPRKRVVSRSKRQVSSIIHNRRSTLTHKSIHSCVNKAFGVSARTLHRCRNIQVRIRSLRENWDALRRGSLSFPSSSLTSGSNNIGATPNNQIDQPYFSTTGNSQQSSKPDCNKSSDVEKAWKMMELAKAKAKPHDGTSRVDQNLRHPTSRGTNTREKKTASPFPHTVRSQQYKIKELRNPAIDEHNTLKKEMAKHRSPEMDEQLCCPVASKKSKASNDVSLTSSSSYQGSSLFNVVQTCKGDISNAIRRDPTNKIMDEASSSSGMTEVSGKGQSAHEVSKNQDAKSEIRTLVKINLKLLDRDKNLGFDRYKEVARLATHTIMAACGLGPPPKSSKQYVSNSVCSHGEEVRQLHRSTLMFDSCRECFFVYVRDVVNGIMSEKLVKPGGN